jgi:MscS family membrane protein
MLDILEPKVYDYYLFDNGAQYMINLFLMRNFINLIDAEGDWFLRLVITLVSVALFSHFLKYILTKLHRKFEKMNHLWKDTLIRALILPVNYYIWFAVLAHSVDLISDRLLSEQFIEEIKLGFSVLAVLMVAWFLLRWKKNLLEVAIEKQKKQEINIDTGRLAAFSKLATTVIIVVTGLLLMEVTGQSIKTLIAFGGISGLAVAIASQEIIGNFFGSFMIYVTRPFSVGDLIHMPASDLEGYVEDIGWYQTRLRGHDKQPVYIPNSLFSKAYVINSSRMTHRKIQEKFSVRHEDFSLVPKIIQDLTKYLDDHPSTDSSEKIAINISGVGTYSIDISVSALSFHTNELEFYKFRDDVFIKAGEIIYQSGAKFAIPIQGVVSNSLQTPR